MTVKKETRIDRRAFLKIIGMAGIAVTTPEAILFAGNFVVMRNSKGFLVVDTGKCMGCGTCMTTCSLTHNGTASLSLSRIQIQQNSFRNWPDDITMSICRQCQDAPCVLVCPTEANFVDAKNGHVRRIIQSKCIGCMRCIVACPYTPRRLQWHPLHRKSQKCDLCVETPYLNEKGGPGGTQACVKVCPVGAITFIEKMPDQRSPVSYETNLRGKGWKLLGGTIEDIDQNR
jgi:protein NrfC